MKSFRIVPFYTGKKTAFYTIHFEGEELSEAERFITTFRKSHERDIQLIINAIARVANKRGASRDELRFEGKSAEALPPPYESSQLRLYCLRISSLTVVLGYGGIKQTKTYQEDPQLLRCVKVLEELDNLIRTLHEEANEPFDIDKFVSQLIYKEEEPYD